MDLKKTSKYLSYLLRHDPAALDLNMDSQGWVGVDELLRKMAAQGRPLDYVDLQRLVAENDKQRFKLDETQRRIRANQGHSIPIELALEEKTPPPVLYHGTAKHKLDTILAEGLKKMNRQHVHLSADVITARRVGGRHGKPAILRVDAQAMRAEQHVFYLSENGVWLTDRVPAGYLSPA